MKDATTQAPLPWSYRFNEQRADKSDNVEILDAEGTVIARVIDNDTLEESIAALIVRAVNESPLQFAPLHECH